MSRSGLAWQVSRRFAPSHSITAVTSTNAVGRALGLREVAIHSLDEVARRTVVVHANGPNAESEADVAFTEHVQQRRGAFEWWVQIHLVLEDGTVHDFEHLVAQYHTNGTIRQAAILHAAWRVMDTQHDNAARAHHLRQAEQLAGKPITIVQPSERELEQHEARRRNAPRADLVAGLRIASRPRADALVIMADLNAPVLSRHAVIPTGDPPPSSPVAPPNTIAECGQ